VGDGNPARAVIPNNFKAIKTEAFSRCSGLTTVTLGEGLEEIGEGAFWRCISLQGDVTNTVKAIKSCAFTSIKLAGPYLQYAGMHPNPLNQGFKHLL
jgi:hypothetical protein